MRLTGREKSRYINEIKKSLICEGTKRERFLSSFSDNIDDYIDEHPDADISQLQADMGTPQEIADGFLENASATVIKRKMNFSRCISACFVSALVILIWAISFVLYTIYQNTQSYGIETINGKPIETEQQTTAEII